MSSFWERIVRAARLDARLYEEVEADPGATGQAVGIVVLSSLAAGLGSVHRGGAAGILIGTKSSRSPGRVRPTLNCCGRSAFRAPPG